MKKIILSILALASFICLVGCVEKAPNSPTITLEGNVVKWEQVPEATGYEVSVGLEKYKTTQTMYVLDLKEEGTYTIVVRAYNDLNAYSIKSNTLTYVVKPLKTQLDAPVITNTNGVIEWAKIANCDKYEVLVNDEVVTTTTTTSYEFNNDEEGTYKIKVRAISTNVLYTTSEESNEIVITVQNQQDPVKLETPVTTLNGKTLSWAAVENADRYFVYVNGELVKTTTELTYEFTDGMFGNYELTVKAISNDNVNFVASDESAKVTVNVKIQETALDLSKPVAMFTLNYKAYAKVNEDNLLVKGSSIGKNLDYQGMSFMLIKDGENYRIKLDNGKYLTWRKASDNDTDEFYAKGLLSSGSTQLFKLIALSTDEYSFMLYPVCNDGYPISENGANGYLQYRDLTVDGKYDPQQVWVIHNVETTIADDVIAPDDSLNGKYVVNNVDEGGYVVSINEFGVGIHKSYANIEDEKQNAWQLIKVTKELGLTSKTDAYYIKLTNGKYLKWGQNEHSGENESVEAVLVDTDLAFVWHFVQNENGYFIWNDAHGKQWANAEYNEGLGHYYFREWWGSLKFGDSPSRWILNKVQVDFSEDAR